MKPLTRADLYSLEEYAEQRREFRARVMAHKKSRQLPIGGHATLHFEDRLTVQYQIQEMLRAERIFEARGIAGELEVYNPLIPDGANWKATFMLEYGDTEVRRRELARLVGIEDRVWVQVAGFDPVRGIADEDLERSTTDKTAAVHFLRFELSPAMVAAVKNGAAIAAGVDHPNYGARVDAVPAGMRAALAADLDG
jgi:hypothetical protein